MYKVSFKSNYLTYKIKNNVTTVILRGTLNIPNDFTLPIPIYIWLCDHPKVIFNPTTKTFTIKAKVVCSKEDTFNELLGKRLAESKAKSILYWHMAQFIDKLLNYYCKYLFGNNLTYEFVQGNKYGNNLVSIRSRYFSLYKKEIEHFDELQK